MYLGTGDDGKIFRLSADHGESGNLESDVHDCSSVAEWGAITWDADTPAGTKVVLATRTGNTEKPDETWSDWSSPYRSPDGSTVTSPPARFLQWRATLTSSDPRRSPALDRVEVAYLQRNLAPLVKSVRISQPDRAVQSSPAQSTPGKSPASGITGSPLISSSAAAARARDGNSSTLPSVDPKRRVTWEAEDPNGDRLTYDIYFRGIEEEEWKRLEKDHPATSLTLDRTAFPDGEYIIKVVARDSPSNPEQLALGAYRVSESFTIDNTPPVLTGVTVFGARGGGQRARARAADGMTRIRAAEYSCDAGQWKAVFPADHIFDTSEESFEFPLPDLEPGEHTLVIRAIDAAGNSGAAKAVFRTR
jgi:hypothetical protein